jgi:hypothetical protein
MSVRNFRDTSGQRWQVKVRSRREWLLEPLLGNPEMPRTVEPPLYAEDPFELSEQELQRILAGAGGDEASSSQPSPFKDDPEFPPKDRPSPFRD